MKKTCQPLLYQINTRVWLTELSRGLRRAATLDDIPDAELDRIAKLGFDWVWLLSVWQTGEVGQKIARTIPELLKEYKHALPDLREEDIVGSGFAISGYTVHEHLGGDAALARLRRRMQQRGLRLMLDFVPNHTARDHPWVENHPEYYVHGTENDLIHAPQNFVRIGGRAGDLVLAHGRDPYFSGWTDTLQLNYGNPDTHAAMTGELLKIAGQCDGVRCDMAMLPLPEVFNRTWGIRAQPFWPAAIRRVRETAPEFCFMAEVYWDLEWELQQQGFDYAYDKRLYDRLIEGNAGSIRDHFRAGLEYQNKLARFLENHDEPRAAAVFPEAKHKAAAVIAYLAPGLKFFHQGQLEGRIKRIPVQLERAPSEAVNNGLRMFYLRFIEILNRPAVQGGSWQLLECVAAWHDNHSFDAFIAFIWRGDNDESLLAAVNFSDQPAQCYVRLPSAGLGGRTWQLRDLMGKDTYQRNGDDLVAHGLYLNVSPWQCHVFEMKPAAGQRP